MRGTPKAASCQRAFAPPNWHLCRARSLSSLVGAPTECAYQGREEIIIANRGGRLAQSRRTVVGGVFVVLCAFVLGLVGAPTILAVADAAPVTDGYSASASEVAGRAYTVISPEMAAFLKRPDYSSPAALASSMSWPLYDGGTASNPYSFTGIRGDDSDTDAVLPAYTSARQEAAEKQIWAGIELGELPMDSEYGHCSNFVATVIINTLTPNFPTFTGAMNRWMRDPSNGWVVIGGSENYDPTMYQPGDVFLTRGSGHTFMWIGEHGRHEDVIAEAAFASDERTRTASLRRYPLDLSTGEDGLGRVYDVWRYIGDVGVDSAIVVPAHAHG